MTEKKRSDIRNKESVWEGDVANDDSQENSSNDSSAAPKDKKGGRTFGKCAMDEV